MDSPLTGYASRSFSEEDRQALSVIIGDPGLGSAEIDPASMAPDDLYHGLELACRSIACFRKAESRLRVALGKMLDSASKTPEVWRSRGYKNFSTFLTEDLIPKIGLGRTVLYQSLKAVRVLPMLDADTFEKLGPTKVETLTLFSPPSGKQYESYVEKALECNAFEFQAWATEHNLIENGEAKAKVILVRANDVISSAWHDFCSDPRVQSTVGSADHGKILAAMIAECSGEWMIQEED